jgi:hypothetical protein
LDTLASKFALLTAPGKSLKTRRYCLRSFFLLLLLGLIGGSAVAGASVQNAPVTSVGLGPQFAIADFDGDRRPDLASIQAGPNSSGTTNYWIQLQLSSVGRQSLRLVAPVGGLQIEARDVNGDHAVDLVFTTAWFNQPVAVLLNNGHGGFSRVEPDVFPGAFSKSTTNWVAFSHQVTDAFGIAPQSGAGICPEARNLLHGRAPTSSISLSSRGFHVSPILISHPGRAPPSEALRF